MSGTMCDKLASPLLSTTAHTDINSFCTAFTKTLPSKPFQELPQTSQELIEGPRKALKRRHSAGDEPSSKRSQRDASALTAFSPDTVGTCQTRENDWQFHLKDKQSPKRCEGSVTESKLSQENLERHNRAWENRGRGTSNEMDQTDTISDRVRKRTLSRQASSSYLNQDTASSRSRMSAVAQTLYRYRVLAKAGIYVHPEPPPLGIQAQLDVIFKREIPEERRREISVIAKDISREFIHNLRGAHREDDLVELIYEALRMMYKDETFSFPRKAGILFPRLRCTCLFALTFNQDWDPSLKPDVRPEFFDLDALNYLTNGAEDVGRPNKRQQMQQYIPSPDVSHPAMPSPPAPRKSKQQHIVKNPRPDFTIGLHQSTVANALVERGLSKVKAETFLELLQTEQKLCSDPTRNYLNVRFPFLVIEGKAYATGKTVFEAQNQAAVSGSYMINLGQQLTDLFEGVFPSSPVREKTLLAFSICTEGPQIEFWVHYALVEDNVRSHYMNILRTCYGSLQAGLEDFLIDVEHLMRWAKDEFLEEVADQLYRLAQHAARG